MAKILVIVDMQRDFIDGALANPAAKEIVPKICEYAKRFDGDLIVCTKDVHDRDTYLQSHEGKMLPVPHCLSDANGVDIDYSIFNAVFRESKPSATIVQKHTFSAGFSLLNAICKVIDETESQDNIHIELCGTCTDICVVSNALMLRERLPEADIICLKDLCAGVTKEKHEAALEVMRSCHIEVV